MPRIARMLINEEPTVYHVISRTALNDFPHGDSEKDYLIEIMKQLNRIYFTEIMGFCIMGNHFHLLVKMIPGHLFSDEDIIQRFKAYYGEEKDIFVGQIPFIREKWSNLSEFVKDIKQMFSRFYNKRNNRKGYFWGDRFKSVIVEKGETLINCLAYIDLNPVRAGIVDQPEAYRWSSIGYHMQTNNKDSLLSLDFGLKEFGVMVESERLVRYREFVYEVGALDTKKGASIKQEIIETERQKGYQISKIDRFRNRTRYFTDSGIIGSKEFVRDNYQKFKDYFQSKHDKKPILVKGLNEIYSMKTIK